MITNKDIRVENGNLVINGDKYPLDGQSPETIMDIVEDNSDTTPTENSTAPITSGGVFTALGTKQDTLTFDSAPTDESTNPVTSGGVYTALDTVNGLLSPISGVVKRFKIDATNQTIDTGINFNLDISKGFIALISSHGSLNSGRMNVYIGGVPHNKQGGIIGDFKIERLGGITLGSSAAVTDNATFSIVDDTLRITSAADQGGVRITMILTTDEIPTP